MRGIFVLIFLVSFLSVHSVSATTYYVSQVDGNDSYNGLYPIYEGGNNGPWLTLAKSVSSVSSGDTVYLRAGTWNEKLVISYRTYTNRTTWARYPSDPVGSVILNGTDLERNQWEDGIVFIDHSNNVRIDGLKVIHAYKTGIAVWGPSGSNHNLEILNCITNNTGQAGIETWYVDGCLIQGNTIYNANIGTMAFGDPSNPWGFEETLSIATSTNVEVSYNTLYGSNRALGAIGGEGLNVKFGSSYVYVHHNYVDQARPDGQESDRYCMGVDGWTSQYGDTHHIYFYNNIVKDGSWGIQYNSEEGGYTHHIYAWNNIISHIGHGNMHGGGIGFPPYGNSPGLCEYCYWWNNIIYDSYYGARFYKEEIASVEVRNNIFYNSKIEDIHFDSGVPQQEVTLDHNLLSSTDPRFVNASGEDFHLQSDSPAIDAGVIVPNVTDDFDGIARPQGVAYDIGAYEYVSVSGPTYYVDSNIGNDANSCSQARNPSTPKRTVNSIMSCNPGAGDTVKFRGTFIHQQGLSQRIVPTQSGQVLYPFQPIQSVSGSVVTFNQPLSGLDPATDYVTVYNSRKGNSGAFAVVSFSGNTVTVDTSDLPLGVFISETVSDPGDLSGAILRPVHFTAWDKNNPPVWDMDLANPPDWPDTEAQTFYSFNQNVIMVSYLKTITDWTIWKAFEIDGNYNTSDPQYHSDYHIFDHLEVTRGDGAIGIEYHDFHTSYNIIQHNNFHDIGYNGSGSDEIIYYGNAPNPGYEHKYTLKHDYVQIMYNKIGPHRVYKDGERLDEVFGDGIELKPSAHYGTIWGNEVTGIQCNGCSDAPIKTDGTNTVISNNYIHDIAPLEEYGLKSCGLSVRDSGPDILEWGASGSIISNNIFANVTGKGIWLLDVKDVKVLNNVIYQVPEDPHEGDLRRNAGIVVWHYLASNTENVEIKNNIIQLVDNHGISAEAYSGTTVSDYNLIFQTPNAFYNVDQGDHDLMIDPGFVNPSSGNFYLQSSSPAIDNGTALSDVAIDFDSISRPQGAGYDIGAYEYANGGPPVPILGDLNNDGRVDITDLAIIAIHFGKRNIHPQWNATADTIPDFEIDVYDIVYVASRFT